jgi:hypothetical protein
MPIGWTRPARLLVHPHAPVRGGAEGEIEHQRCLLARRDADADRIESGQLVDAAPGRHGRQRAGRGDADHVRLDRQRT